MKIGIVFTGIIEEYYIDDFIRLYSNIDEIKYCKIVSTWRYTSENILNKLQENGFKIILSDFPEELFKVSVNYYLYSFIKGSNYLIDNTDITHLLHIRSDLNIPNIHLLLHIYENIYCGKPIFIGCFKHNEGYLLCYTYLLSVDFYKSIHFRYQTPLEDTYPEKYMQELFFGTSDWKILIQCVTSSILHLIDNNVEIHFLKQPYVSQGNLLINYFTKCNGFYL